MTSRVSNGRESVGSGGLSRRCDPATSWRTPIGCVHHDLGAAYELVSDDYVSHDPKNPNFTGGREAKKSHVQGLF